MNSDTVPLSRLDVNFEETWLAAIGGFQAYRRCHASDDCSGNVTTTGHDNSRRSDLTSGKVDIAPFAPEAFGIGDLEAVCDSETAVWRVELNFEIRSEIVSE